MGRGGCEGTSSEELDIVANGESRQLVLSRHRVVFVRGKEDWVKVGGFRAKLQECK